VSKEFVTIFLGDFAKNSKKMCKFPNLVQKCDKNRVFGAIDSLLIFISCTGAGVSPMGAAEINGD